MTDANRGLSLPVELVYRWAHDSPLQYSDENWGYELFIANQAVLWASDVELKECCKWIANVPDFYSGAEIDLRNYRRPPRPLTLREKKEKALSELAAAVAGGNITPERGAFIRLALEEIPDEGVAPNPTPSLVAPALPPRSGLVASVARALGRESADPSVWEPQACAAITAMAAWLGTYETANDVGNYWVEDVRLSLLREAANA